MNEEVKGSVVADAKGWISKDCLAFLIECFAVGLLVQGVKVDSFTETSTKKKKRRKDGERDVLIYQHQLVTSIL